MHISFNHSSLANPKSICGNERPLEEHKRNGPFDMHAIFLALCCLVGTALAAQTGDILGECTTDQLNEETCYDVQGFEQCGENGWVYQECPVGTYCYNSGGGVMCK